MSSKKGGVHANHLDGAICKVSSKVVRSSNFLDPLEYLPIQL